MAEIAGMMGVADSTLRSWQDDAEFSAAIKNGKNQADAHVLRSLYVRAVGSKFHAADTIACIFWLKNRRPDAWKDKHDGTISGPAETGGKIVVEVVQVQSRKKEEPAQSGPAGEIKLEVVPAAPKPQARRG